MLGNFSYFCQSIMPPEWFDDIFHVQLCNHLQYGGHESLVVLPRAFLKTTIAATYFPLWLATQDPSRRFLITSNTSPNAEKTVHEIRSIVESNKIYQAFFPECIPRFNKVRWSDRCACLNRVTDYPEGTFESAGVGANVIRRHFNGTFEDDTVAPKKDELSGDEVMPSRDDIEKAVGFHKLTIPLLINEFDWRVITATRWASYDLVNYVLKNEKFAIFDKPCYNDDGSPLYKRFSMSRLEKIKAGLGTKMFSMLYLNTPLPKEYMTFNPDWLKYYEEHELPEEGESVITVDPADPPTGKKSQDYSAIMSVKHTRRGKFVRRYVRERVSDKQMIDKSFNMAEQDGAIKIRIEVNRYGHLEAAFREAMALRGVHYIIDAVKARGKKEERIKSRLSPLFENGVIYLKKHMRELEEELFTFPGKHDDLIDALSWQIERYTARDIEKPVVKKKTDYSVFTLDQIRKSCQGRSRAPYPFSKQLEGSVL